MPLTHDPAAVDAYVGALDPSVQPVLDELRRRLLAAVPDAGEAISYRMPTITTGGEALMYVAAWKRHIGVYPVPIADPELERDLAPLRAAKDTVRLPLAQPIPYELVERVARFLLERRAADGECAPWQSLPERVPGHPAAAGAAGAAVVTDDVVARYRDDEPLDT